MLFCVRASVRTMLLVCTRTQVYHCRYECVGGEESKNQQNFAHHANDCGVGDGVVNLNSDALKMNILCPFPSIFFTCTLHITWYTSRTHTPNSE